MKFYDSLSRFGFLKKYSYKFLFIAFVGIHIPLIGIIAFILTSQRDVLSSSAIMILALILTLIATGVTLFFLNRLLDPLIVSKDALENYIEKGDLPDLPSKYSDEAGVLMQRLQSTLSRLDALVHSKDMLIGLVSHDVRKPLSHIISYAELAQQSDDPAKVRKYTSRIIESGKLQLQMLDRILLMLKQHEIGMDEAEPDHVSLSEILGEVRNNNVELLDAKSVTFQPMAADGISLSVHRELFEHVIQNLVHNAVKFSEAGGTITCTASRNGRYTQIYIRDEGIGFEPADNEAIFHRFTNKQQEGTSGEESTGLGLYLCRQIVEKHGGTLTASSEGKGRGSTFTIRLPQGAQR